MLSLVAMYRALRTFERMDVDSVWFGRGCARSQDYPFGASNLPPMRVFRRLGFGIAPSIVGNQIPATPSEVHAVRIIPYS